jgi:hypothetical protein
MNFLKISVNLVLIEKEHRIQETAYLIELKIAAALRASQ